LLAPLRSTIPDRRRGLEIFGKPIEQYLPAKYNEESDMKITDESEMTQDYDLVSSG
jgi:hypothetical protein